MEAQVRVGCHTIPSFSKATPGQRSANLRAQHVPSFPQNSIPRDSCHYCERWTHTPTVRSLASSSFLSDVSLFSPRQTHSIRRPRDSQIRALDAAMPFDYESKKQRELREKSKLLIGVVGFGNFGQFMAGRMIKQGHQVLGYSRGDYSAIAKDMGARYYRDLDDFCEEHPDVVILCTSILSTEKVLRSVPFQRLRRSTLFVDMLSVKEFPKALFQNLLPKDFDLLCTHPMFGPESGKGAWTALPFVYDKVRVGKNHTRQDRCDRFLKIFEQEGCRMVEMTCEEHDKYAASSQFITHTVGRVLGQLALETTPINTKGYETLLSLVDNTCKDSFDLYYGLFMYNINATEELEKLERSFDAVKKQLFDQLHDILRAQLFQSTEVKRMQQDRPQLTAAPRPLMLPAPSTNGSASTNGSSSANGSSSTVGSATNVNESLNNGGVHASNGQKSVSNGVPGSQLEEGVAAAKK